MNPGQPLRSPNRMPRSSSGRATQSPPIVRTMVIDALQSWVVPTLMGGSAALFWILSSLGVWREPVAVVGIATSLLVLSLFASLRHYLFSDDPRQRRVSLVLATCWGLLLFVPFFRCNFPGVPVAAGDLEPSGPTLAVPHGGLYSVVVDGRFTPSREQATRVGHYRIDAVSPGRPARTIEGSFEDRFGVQRVGRRGTAPVEYRQTSQRHVIRLLDRTSLRLTESDATLEPGLRVSLYPAPNPWIFRVLGVTGILLALVLEKRADGDGSATMAASATFCIVDQYLQWAAPYPQVKSLVGAILVGSFLGAPAAAVLWRIVPRRWLVGRR
jgi:hypothetical protein